MDDFLRRSVAAPPHLNPLWPHGSESRTNIDLQLLLESAFLSAPPTWSWTSSSHSSSCMMCSKGRNSASLKWKCGGSAQLVRTSVSTSWMKETAFWETWRSWWHAACRTGGGSVSGQEVATSGGEEAALRTKFVSCVFYCLLWKKCCQTGELAHLHQVGRHHTPGTHLVQQGAAAVADDAQHGLAQADQVEDAAAVQRGLGPAYRDRDTARSTGRIQVTSRLHRLTWEVRDTRQTLQEQKWANYGPPKLEEITLLIRGDENY